MDILTLSPLKNGFEARYFGGTSPSSSFALSVDDCRGPGNIRRALQSAFTRINAGGKPPDVVIGRSPHGGDVFDRPVIANADVLRKLRALAPLSPVHLPLMMEVMESSSDIFCPALIGMDFETAFFVALPERERNLALDKELSRRHGFRRYGYHGIHHKAAAEYATTLAGPDARLASICLEPRPEIAAVAAGCPLMVSGGSTPLEGLPGEHACGEIDPSIITIMARELKMGPEEIDHLLTVKSGLSALAERNIPLPELLGDRRPDDARLRFAREVFLYKLLQYCGSTIGAMGGIDGIVFSGRYAACGSAIGPWLLKRLPADRRERRRKPQTIVFDKDIHAILADTGRRLLTEMVRK